MRFRPPGRPGVVATLGLVLTLGAGCGASASVVIGSAANGQRSAFVEMMQGNDAAFQRANKGLVACNIGGGKDACIAASRRVASVVKLWIRGIDTATVPSDDQPGVAALRLALDDSERGLEMRLRSLTVTRGQPLTTKQRNVLWTQSNDLLKKANTDWHRAATEPPFSS